MDGNSMPHGWLNLFELHYKEGELSFATGPLLAILLLLGVGFYLFRFLRSGGRLVPKKLGLKTPIGDFDVEVDRSEEIAAWQIYVEMMTRIASQPLAADQGILRESLNSLYELFLSVRKLLQATTPPHRMDTGSVGLVAAAILNKELRPFLTKWHPLLQIWEAQRAISASVAEHEKSWSRNAEFRADLYLLQKRLIVYAAQLAKAANISPRLHAEILLGSPMPASKDDAA